MRKKILCIDDEPNNLEVMRHALNSHYQLSFASGGDAGIAAIKKHQPDLILLDIEMPEVNGYDVALWIKSNPDYALIPFIFVTSLREEQEEQIGFDLGAVDYIAKPLSLYRLRARVAAHLSLVKATELEKSQHAAIYMLGEAGHYNDTDTGMHIWRMAEYSRLIAEAVGWEKDFAKLLELAAPMHDTGKIGTPDAILKKPAKLSPEEWQEMQNHSQIGYDILSKSDTPIFQLAAEIALNHHEKWSGGGYPNNLIGDSIPESARIVAVADIFDALTSKRPYKEAWPIEEAFETIKTMSGPHLEPRLVEAFCDIFPSILKAREKWNAREAKTGGNSIDLGVF